jgi:transaldolase/glucose-6-phosphate isomerase
MVATRRRKQRETKEDDMDLRTVHPKYGQSLWLDYIRRHSLRSGEFARLVLDDGIRGVTSNPSIFEKAIAGSTDYESALKRFEGKEDTTASAIYEHLAIEDIQQAADILRPVYDATDGHDGYVSMEVSPYLAHDTGATLDEARRFWKTVHRENLMIKVPGTPEGVPAIRQLIGEGINVNVTLLFSRAACREVAVAYMDGLEALAARGGDLRRIASVASMFVSRVDVLVDPALEALAPAPEKGTPHDLLGKVAIANAKLAYQDWREMRGGARWQALAAKGARVQRLLWASTSTKDPRFRDVMYVESLMGDETVDTVPPATLDAFRDHGKAASRIEEDVAGAERVMADLARAGISIDDVTSRLLDEGVAKFSAAFDKLLAAVEKKRAGTLASTLDRMTYRLPPSDHDAVRATLEDWTTGGKMRRLWARDASLWTKHDEGSWLDWLTVVDDEAEAGRALVAFATATVTKFTNVVLLGMGGSSLCTDVMARTFGAVQGFPEPLVLDSTDPQQIRALESRIDIATTLFIVASKSGTTLEPKLLMEHFYNRVRNVVANADAGAHFIVVTDPGSPLEAIARSRGFRRVFFGVPGIGGRYSALSNFGMVPGALMGVDVPRFLERASLMVHSCAACVPPEENPGALLGAILGTLATRGRDKVTLVASPGIVHLGAWLEQLLAESTGKEGKGIIPVDREPLGPPEVYGADRLFVYLRLDGAPDAAQEAAVTALEGAGQPVVRIGLADAHDLAEEFFRWEIATAVAGAIIGINPFNQPDVEASKVAARKLTDAYEKARALPKEDPFFEEGAFKLFADEKNHVALEEAAGSDKTLAGYLRAHFGRAQRGDYVALLAFIERSDAHDQRLQAMRRAIRDSKHVATCVGFGPRFLHATGQVYKGGPNTGVFLQLTCDDAEDLMVPDHAYSFGVVKAAQARGDFRVLVERSRRALRVHIGSDVRAGLDGLRTAIERALA